MTKADVSVFGPADSKEQSRALEVAESAITAGRTISHDAMRRWLLSWGKRGELPPPKCGE